MERAFTFLQIVAFTLFIILKVHPHPYIVGLNLVVSASSNTLIPQFEDKVYHKIFKQGYEVAVKYHVTMINAYVIMLFLAITLWIYTIPLYLNDLLFKKWDWYRSIILYRQAERIYFKGENDKRNLIRRKMKNEMEFKIKEEEQEIKEIYKGLNKKFI